MDSMTDLATGLFVISLAFLFIPVAWMVSISNLDSFESKETCMAVLFSLGLATLLVTGWIIQNFGGNG